MKRDFLLASDLYWSLDMDKGDNNRIDADDVKEAKEKGQYWGLFSWATFLLFAYNGCMHRPSEARIVHVINNICLGGNMKYSFGLQDQKREAVHLLCGLSKHYQKLAR